MTRSKIRISDKQHKRMQKYFKRQKHKVVHLSVPPHTETLLNFRKKNPYKKFQPIKVDRNYIVKNKETEKVVAALMKDVIPTLYLEKVENVFEDPVKVRALFEKKKNKKIDNKRGAHKGGTLGVREEIGHRDHLCKAPFPKEDMPVVDEFDQLLQPIAKVLKFLFIFHCLFFCESFFIVY